MFWRTSVEQAFANRPNFETMVINAMTNSPDTDGPESVPRMPDSSRYAGEPIEVTSRRSIQIVSQSSTGALIGSDDQDVTIDFFLHEGEFWRAVVPLTCVVRVHGQAFNFSKPRTRRGISGPEVVYDRQGLPKRRLPCLNHVQTRFICRPDQPLRLYPLGTDPTGPPHHEVHDFVYSTEAVGPPGVSFNFWDAFAGNLLSAHRFVSTREVVFERIVVEGQHLTESPPLPVSAAQCRTLLSHSLLRSHRANLQEVYYLFSCRGTNNCTSTPLQIVDRVADYSWTQRLGSFFFRLPISPRFYLRVRGLDVDPTCRRLLRQEFQAYIDDPLTQRRKRDYVKQKIRAVRQARANRKTPPSNLEARTSD